MFHQGFWPFPLYLYIHWTLGTYVTRKQISGSWWAITWIYFGCQRFIHYGRGQNSINLIYLLYLLYILWTRLNWWFWTHRKAVRQGSQCWFDVEPTLICLFNVESTLCTRCIFFSLLKTIQMWPFDFIRHKILLTVSDSIVSKNPTECNIPNYISNTEYYQKVT